jgi:nucleotide-binding universal stress UspA family protein
VTSQESPPQGDRIDGFVLAPPLHRGAMSTICRVVGVEGRAAPGFPAVMKRPRTGIGEGVESVLGFETEVRILPALSGAHVPRFVAAGDLGRSPYLVAEWVEGESLQQMLSRAPLPAERVAALGAQTADALHSIHRQGAIHFDVKPDNVIIRPGGEAVLIDFGMARHARFPDLHAEERRFASGSAPYISPEQVLGNRLDPRSDIYSLGVVLYELSTGKLPFGVPRTLAGLRDRIWLDPAPPRMIAAAVPPWLQEVILRCLEPVADERYQSADEVARDLRNPARVALSARAGKTRRAGLLAQTMRWWKARAQGAPRPPQALVAPVIMVAVDTMHPDDLRHPALRRETGRILSLNPDFRLICVSVVRGEPLVADANHPGIHLEHLTRLRQWVEGLAVPENRLSLHAIQSLSPASTLVQFARDNNVNLLVIGAPGPSQQAFAWWRSVASSVTANAHCSVYVVRVAHDAEDH